MRRQFTKFTQSDKPAASGDIWLQVVLASVAAISAMATVSAGPNGALWVKVVVGFTVSAFAILSWRRIRPAVVVWRQRRAVERNWKKWWPRFILEVRERTRIFASSDTRGLGSLLMAIRDQPQLDQLFPKAPPTAADRAFREELLRAYTRVAVLQSSSAAIAAASSAVFELARLIAMGWPGSVRAKATVNAFESLFAYPEAARLCSTLTEQSRGTRDRQVVEEWLEYYRDSRRRYGEFARVANLEIGEKVFGEHFGA